LLIGFCQTNYIPTVTAVVVVVVVTAQIISIVLMKFCELSNYLLTSCGFVKLVVTGGLEKLE